MRAERLWSGSNGLRGGSEFDLWGHMVLCDLFEWLLDWIVWISMEFLVFIVWNVLFIVCHVWIAIFFFYFTHLFLVVDVQHQL